MGTFNASVKYNDFEGSAAADRDDSKGLRSWLTENEYLDANKEIIVGIRMSAGENYGVHKDPVSVNFFIATLDNYNNLRATGNLQQPLRQVHVDIPIAEFLSLFKRFEVTLSLQRVLEGIDIENEIY